MIRRHGQTPIQWAHALGLLGPGHDPRRTRCISTRIPGCAGTPGPISTILGDTGTAVAHCPTPFARYGHVHGGFRRLSARRGRHGARHRLRAAQSRRGDAQGGGAGPHRRARHRHRDDIGPVPRRDGRRRDGADARRYRPHRARHEGRSGAARSGLSADAAGRATRCARSSIMRPTARCATCSSTGSRSSPTGAC